MTVFVLTVGESCCDQYAAGVFTTRRKAENWIKRNLPVMASRTYGGPSQKDTYIGEMPVDPMDSEELKP